MYAIIQNNLRFRPLKCISPTDICAGNLRLTLSRTTSLRTYRLFPRHLRKEPSFYAFHGTSPAHISASLLTSAQGTLVLRLPWHFLCPHLGFSFDICAADPDYTLSHEVSFCHPERSEGSGTTTPSCHPERSEGSGASIRLKATDSSLALRMTWEDTQNDK